MDRSVGAVVYRKQSGQTEFLLIYSSRHGFWDLPKGHPEGAETEQETALREVAEETGCTVQIQSGFRATSNYLLPSGEPKEVVFLLAKLVSENGKGLIDPAEIGETVWLSGSEAVRRLTYDKSRAILHQAAEFLQ